MLPSENATAIVADRQSTYGHPMYVYLIWASLLKPIISAMQVEERDTPKPEEAAMMLVLLKAAREIAMDYRTDYRDNEDDMVGYVNVLHIIKEYLADRTEPDATRAPDLEGEELPGPKPTRRSSGNGRRTRGAKSRNPKSTTGNKRGGRRKRS